jgi:hypothetical protein
MRHGLLEEHIRRVPLDDDACRREFMLTRNRESKHSVTAAANACIFRERHRHVQGAP